MRWSVRKNCALFILATLVFLVGGEGQANEQPITRDVVVRAGTVEASNDFSGIIIRNLEFDGVLIPFLRELGLFSLSTPSVNLFPGETFTLRAEVSGFSVNELGDEAIIDGVRLGCEDGQTGGVVGPGCIAVVGRLEFTATGVVPPLDGLTSTVVTTPFTLLPSSQLSTYSHKYGNVYGLPKLGISARIPFEGDSSICQDQAHILSTCPRWRDKSWRRAPANIHCHIFLCSEPR